ncbi:MAG: hypothetical protein H6551_02500 [Chitinophagales bacterium]|nr:hypothetical protein [Chitinophagaceae bacterium]MCB9063992.1 hypothetical protein [Chitinophagales bacterium]
MRYLWIPLAALLFFSACTSKPETNNITPGTNNPAQTDSSYIVSGLTDISIGLYRDSATLVLGIQHVSGQQLKVNFSVTDLPDGISASLSPQSGIPPFATTVRFQSDYAKPGTYPIKLKGVSESGKVNTYTIDMKVTGNLPPCNTLLSQSAFNLRTTLKGSSAVISDKAFFYGDTRLQYM